MSNPAGKEIIYEINTPVWLHEVSARHNQLITLENVPDSELDALARPGVTLIWMMGIWERSKLGRENALRYIHEYQAALPDVQAEDVIGSAYSIGSYTVAESYGGRAGLASFRARLRERGLRLMLDYVPNHVGIDHPWVSEPGFIVRGRAADTVQRPSDFFRYTTAQGRTVVLAHGRDPFFPGWSDTAQLNIFHKGLRRAVLATLKDIAAQCDGLRCDMAMLLLNDVFAATWNHYLREKPGVEFWAEVILAVKALHPEFIFMAEVYWGKEGDLLRLGFDLVYDKVFYDRVIAGEVADLRQHLAAPMEFQRRTVRFIENHDEPRALTSLGVQRNYAAAVLVLTAPGVVLLHDGQLTGRAAKLPVQIRRAPNEPQSAPLHDYYLRLLREITDPVYQNGQFALFEVSPAAPHNATYTGLVAYGWYVPNDGFRLVVVNLSGQHAYGVIDLALWAAVAGREWRLFDVLDGAEYLRRGDDLSNAGLHVSLEAFEAHIFRFEPAGAQSA